jgi:hypothetical protein
LLLATLPNSYGDYNQNGIVDAGDYLVWRRTKGILLPRGTGADGNANGVVDNDDFNFWRTRFGTAVPRGSGGTLETLSVPETGSALAVMTGIIVLLTSTIRHRSNYQTHH